MTRDEKLLKLILEAEKKEPKAPSLEDLAAAQGITPEELMRQKEELKAKLARTSKAMGRTPRKPVAKPQARREGSDTGIRDQVIEFNTANNKFNGILKSNAKETSGEVTALNALRTMHNFIKGIDKAAGSTAAKLDRKPYKELRKTLLTELAKNGVSSLNGEIMHAVNVTDDMDDETEKRLLKLLASPYGVDKSEVYDEESGEIEKVKSPIKGPYRSFISQMGLSPYFGNITKKETGGSRYMATNPYSAISMEWNMDDEKRGISNSSNLNKLLDGAAAGKLKPSDLEYVQDLYESYLVDKRIADEIADATGVDYSKLADKADVQPAKEDSDIPEDELIDVDMDLEDLAEEQRNLQNKAIEEKLMKLNKEESVRRKMIIEESRKYFSDKKKTLVSFVEESLEGLTVSQAKRVKSKLTGKNGEWIKKNISSVIRSVVEESLRSKRKLIRESRSEGRSLVVESRGRDDRHAVTENDTRSLVEESVNAKMKRKPNLIEESAPVVTNDAYSKAGMFL